MRDHRLQRAARALVMHGQFTFTVDEHGSHQLTDYVLIPTRLYTDLARALPLLSPQSLRHDVDPQLGVGKQAAL